MADEIVKGVPLPSVFRRRHDVSNGRLEIMALMYDLDGALAAGQVGLARHTAVNLLEAGVAAWLRERAVAVPGFTQAPARARSSLSILEAVNPDLARRVAAGYAAVLPTSREPVTEYCETILRLVGELLGYGETGLSSVVAAWADSAQTMRTLCELFGVPVSDFYWAPADAESWHSDVLRFAAAHSVATAQPAGLADEEVTSNA